LRVNFTTQQDDFTRHEVLATDKAEEGGSRLRAVSVEIFKQCLCEISVGCTLFLQLSQIFSKDTFLNRFQRNEIIKFIKSRVPTFISQLQLLQNVLVIMKSLHGRIFGGFFQIILALDVTTELLENLSKSSKLFDCVTQLDELQS
jgi:hypothetical protein